MEPEAALGSYRKLVIALIQRENGSTDWIDTVVNPYPPVLRQGDNWNDYSDGKKKAAWQFVDPEYKGDGSRLPAETNIDCLSSALTFTSDCWKDTEIQKYLGRTPEPVDLDGMSNPVRCCLNLIVAVSSWHSVEMIKKDKYTAAEQAMNAKLAARKKSMLERAYNEADYYDSIYAYYRATGVS